MEKTKTMNKQEQKNWIKKQWKVSSGERIAEMLRRYWGVTKSIVKTAEDIFDAKSD